MDERSSQDLAGCAEITQGNEWLLILVLIFFSFLLKKVRFYNDAFPEKNPLSK